MVTCNPYRDAWSPFLEFFKRYWPQCPYPKYLVTDDIDPLFLDLDPFLYFKVADNRWAKRLLKFCQAIQPESVLLLHEDYFLSGPVREDKIRFALEQLIRKHEAGCVRLFPCPGPENVIDKEWGQIEPGAPYRISCQAALWRTDYLCRILEQVNTSPEFELLGTPFSRGLPDAVYSWRREETPWPMEYYCTAIVQGKWQRGALDLCARHHIKVDTSKRPIDERAL